MIRLNGIFKDNMVLQRDSEIRIFGITDEASVKACVMDGDKVLTKGETSNISSDGSFVLSMDKLSAGGPYSILVEAGESRITVNDVYIGEVWIAGGQSNMEYPLGRSGTAREDVPACPDTAIHFYKVPVVDRCDSETLKAESATSWDVITKDTCYDMSAVAFYFARKLEDVLNGNDGNAGDKNIHIGVIGCYFGGTSVTCWQSITKLESTEEGRKFIADYKADSSVYASYDEYLKAEKDYEDKAGIYEGKVAEVLKKDRFLTYYDTELITGGGPWPPPKGPESVRRPGALFEGMVRRIVPMAVRGVIFYQGEEDTERYSREYGVLFKSMIDEWRDIFREEKLPFIYCQLPEFEPEDDVNWPELRRQQKRISEEVPCAYMADLTGCGEVGNVHPSQKKIPGERLAKLAVRFVYGL